MTVAAAWREQGVGRLLLQALPAWATEHPQIEKVGLRALASNERAVRLYTRVGFVEEGRRPKTIKLGPAETLTRSSWFTSWKRSRAQRSAQRGCWIWLR
jgi:RimJ/RimL family protein N-acetyltransferase